MMPGVGLYLDELFFDNYHSKIIHLANQGLGNGKKAAITDASINATVTLTKVVNGTEDSDEVSEYFSNVIHSFSLILFCLIVVSS